MIVSRLYANSRLHHKGNTTILWTSEPKEFERLVFRLRLAVEKEPDDALGKRYSLTRY